MKNELINVKTLREMDKIAASMKEDYTLEDLIKAVECQEDFSQPHSLEIKRSDDSIGRPGNKRFKCTECKETIRAKIMDKKWNFCPYCGYPILWEED